MTGPSIDVPLLDEFLRGAEQVQAEDPTDIDGSRYILLLKIFRWQLLRRERSKPAGLDDLGVLKTGIRNAELLLETVHTNEAAAMEGWHFGCNPKNAQQRFCNFIWMAVLSLTAEVIATERQHPQLKDAFDRERADYRKMKLEAEEAMNND